MSTLHFIKCFQKNLSIPVYFYKNKIAVNIKIDIIIIIYKDGVANDIYIISI